MIKVTPLNPISIAGSLFPPSSGISRRIKTRTHLPILSFRHYPRLADSLLPLGHFIEHLSWHRRGTPTIPSRTRNSSSRSCSGPPRTPPSRPLLLPTPRPRPPTRRRPALSRSTTCRTLRRSLPRSRSSISSSTSSTSRPRGRQSRRTPPRPHPRPTPIRAAPG